MTSSRLDQPAQEPDAGALAVDAAAREEAEAREAEARKAEAREAEAREAEAAGAAGKPRRYKRFALPQRVEHIIQLVSFTVLAVTGLPQKYAEMPFAIGMINLAGGIETVRIVHRWAAVILMVASIYHIAAMGYRIFVTRSRLTMLPGLSDVADALQAFSYNLRIARKPPRMGYFNFAEKAEYWAFIWGTVVMVATGFMLWNPIATTNFLPGQVIPAAKAAHGAEAILAVLSILLWHFYHVHVKVFNRSMFTGYISRHEMEHEHAAELERIESGYFERPPEPAVVRRRARVYVPVTAVVFAALIIALFYFVTFEDTAIQTLPSPNVQEAVLPAPDPAAEPGS
jgi:cytochrome b subunit of formate dehydrogenase